MGRKPGPWEGVQLYCGIPPVNLQKPKTLLVVEDDEDFQLLYRLYLQGRSYRIQEARNGKEALEAIEKEKPDLIVLDMIMPEMDGEEFLEKLRFEKKMTEIPVIIASVNDKIPPSLLARAKVRNVLKKPFPMENLLEKVKAALGD